MSSSLSLGIWIRLYYICAYLRIGGQLNYYAWKQLLSLLNKQNFGLGDRAAASAAAEDKVSIGRKARVEILDRKD